MENKKFDIDFKDNQLHLSLDSNKDGQKLVEAKVNLNEAIQEVLNKGEPVKDAKLVGFEFNLSKLVLQLDTDKDGEHLLELEIDLAEAIDEAGLFKKEEKAEEAKE